MLWTKWTLWTMVVAMAALAGCNGTVGVVGNDDFLGLRLMQAGESLTRAGVEIDWTQDVAPGGIEAVGVSGVVMYDLVQNAPFRVLTFEAPVTWSVGGRAGLWYVDSRDFAPGAALLTQVMFGDEVNRAGVEVSKGVDGQLWGDPFAEAPSGTELMFTGSHRWK